MTDDQKLRAQAWEQLAASPHARLALDDLTVFANSLPESQQAGACKLLLYLLTKSAQLRRLKMKGAS